MIPMGTLASLLFFPIVSTIFFTCSVGDMILFVPQNDGSKAEGRLLTKFFLFHSLSLVISFVIVYNRSVNIISKLIVRSRSIFFFSCLYPIFFFDSIWLNSHLS